MVGQVVNLQRVGNPLRPPLSTAGPISNRPQIANLPHHGRYIPLSSADGPYMPGTAASHSRRYMPSWAR